jgi:hypothetical protein
MKLHVQPIYGWGWFDSENASVAVPEPFALAVSVGEEGDSFRVWLGQAENPAHSLTGLWILLNQRHDSCYSLRAFTGKPDLQKTPGPVPCLTGYVMVTSAGR